MAPPLSFSVMKCKPSATENGPYDYTRSGNPARDVLESLLAKLDKADRAFCFTSGMAALSAVAHLVGTGEEIVAGDDIYGGSDRLLSKVIPKTGVVVKRVYTTSLDEITSAIGPWTKLVWLESPTNPRQMVSNIREIVKMAHAHDALVLVDNSIMSPVVSQPLELGADIVMHSATKFIAGHSDVMAGVLAVRGERLCMDFRYCELMVGHLKKDCPRLRELEQKWIDSSTPARVFIPEQSESGTETSSSGVAGQDKVSGICKVIAAFKYFAMEIRKHRDGFRGGATQESGSALLIWAIVDQYSDLYVKEIMCLLES
ncbi:cystathionine beta-lyase, chloroplastic-like [Humulus lupulus]|uniref:cystathionine beta-lyase, chloroplastic-like n=1 Tax=Humulus lupulus TaxID=3486 RepID=UPI002B406D2D|nr:cystathionine beta-lyase, chloroplastic-like [Humulus lupulus]